MKKLFFLVAIVGFLTSCNVTESIIFNKDMSGLYTSSFDMSPMLKIANSQGSSSETEENAQKIDTTIVFNDLYVTHKDSVAALSADKRARLDKLRGMTMTIHTDEANSIFNFGMTKPFKAIKDLENVNDQIGEAFTIVQDIGNKDGQTSADQIGQFSKNDEVVYTFADNTFSRFQPVNDEDIEEDTDEDAEEMNVDDFNKQFEDVFASSFYTLEYKFPRKVKSVSNANATISEDGKTVMYKQPWNAINKDKTLMNLNIVLED